MLKIKSTANFKHVRCTSSSKSAVCFISSCDHSRGTVRILVLVTASENEVPFETLESLGQSGD